MAAKPTAPPQLSAAGLKRLHRDLIRKKWKIKEQVMREIIDWYTLENYDEMIADANGDRSGVIELVQTLKLDYEKEMTARATAKWDELVKWDEAGKPSSARTEWFNNNTPPNWGKTWDWGGSNSDLQLGTDNYESARPLPPEAQELITVKRYIKRRVKKEMMITPYEEEVYEAMKARGTPEWTEKAKRFKERHEREMTAKAEEYWWDHLHKSETFLNAIEKCMPKGWDKKWDWKTDLDLVWPLPSGGGGASAEPEPEPDEGGGGGVEGVPMEMGVDGATEGGGDRGVSDVAQSSNPVGPDSGRGAKKPWPLEPTGVSDVTQRRRPLPDLPQELRQHILSLALTGDPYSPNFPATLDDQKILNSVRGVDRIWRAAAKHYRVNESRNLWRIQHLEDIYSEDDNDSEKDSDSEEDSDSEDDNDTTMRLTGDPWDATQLSLYNIKRFMDFDEADKIIEANLVSFDYSTEGETLKAKRKMESELISAVCRFPNLRELVLYDNDHLRFRFTQALAEHCRELRKVEFKETFIGDDSMLTLVKACPKMYSVSYDVGGHKDPPKSTLMDVNVQAKTLTLMWNRLLPRADPEAPRGESYDDLFFDTNYFSVSNLTIESLWDNQCIPEIAWPDAVKKSAKSGAPDFLHLNCQPREYIEATSGAELGALGEQFKSGKMRKLALKLSTGGWMGFADRYMTKFFSNFSYAKTPDDHPGLKVLMLGGFSFRYLYPAVFGSMVKHLPKLEVLSLGHFNSILGDNPHSKDWVDTIVAWAGENNSESPDSRHPLRYVFFWKLPARCSRLQCGQYTATGINFNPPAGQEPDALERWRASVRDRDGHECLKILRVEDINPEAGGGRAEPGASEMEGIWTPE